MKMATDVLLVKGERAVPTIGERLKAARNRASMSLQQTALALEEHGVEIGRNAVHSYETGTAVKAENLWALCRIYRANPLWVLSGRGDPDLDRELEGADQFRNGVDHALDVMLRAIEGLRANGGPGPFPRLEE